MAERVLPHSLEAERAVIGGLLVDDSLFDLAAGIVSPAHFYRDAHQRVWRAIVAVRAANMAIDLVTVAEELQRRGELDEVGGPAYVASLVDNVPRASNVEYYARIVRDKAVLRRLIFSANRIVTDAYEAEQAPDVLVDQAERLIMDVGTAAVTGGDFVLADDWMRETSAQVEKAALAKRIVTGIPSGIPKLDRWTRGWQDSDLIYLGARPSAGKTSLALQLALEASKHAMTGFVSLEMSRRVVGMRAVAMEARVDAFRLMTGHLGGAEMDQVSRAMVAIAERRLAIDDATGLTGTQLRAKVRRLASRYGLDIVFIDYMQLLQDDSGAENRNLELSRISASLKGLARELDIPVFVLSQLARASARENRRPQASDLRDSGSLEQDADIVLLLHRPNQTDTARFEDDETAELIIAKQRNGPTGLVPLKWLGEQMRFGGVDEAPASQPQQGALV